jgi:antitoxin (DNA-binding transcriptional repressor) of toxin-antitoxin stability system
MSKNNGTDKKKKETVIITKRNIPIVKVSPIEEKETPIFGAMANTIHIIGNIVEPIEEVWDGCS